MAAGPATPRKRKSALDEGRRALDMRFADGNFIFLTRLVRSYVRQIQPGHFGDLDIVPGEIAMLSIVGENAGVSQHELADVLLLKRSAVTKIVQQLLDRGLIRRDTVAADRRYSALSLTPSGRRLWQELRKRSERHNREVLQGLSPTERRELLRLMAKLKTSLANVRGEPRSDGLSDRDIADL